MVDNWVHVEHRCVTADRSNDDGRLRRNGIGPGSRKVSRPTAISHRTAEQSDSDSLTDSGDFNRTQLIFEPDQWKSLEQEHQAEVDALTANHRARSFEHRAHPVEDFLFTYYSLRPSQLRRWHPGAGVGLLDAPERATWRFHRTLTQEPTGRPIVRADTAQFMDIRQQSIRFIRELLQRTAAAVPQFGCFGLHEWAMVFQGDERRHLTWPLRLGREGTDNVIQAQQIRCSHYDAFRFFTPAAQPRNLLTPDLASRDRMEQPGCLHASMDLYKWAYRLIPIVSSRLLVDCFRFAKAIREVDMRASPYDLSELGYPAITIENAAGRAEYVVAQKEFARGGQQLRARLLAELDAAFGPGDPIADLPSTIAPPTTTK